MRAPRSARKGKHGGARKGAGRPKGSTMRPRTVETIKSYVDLGDAPKDELDAIRWAFRANAVSLHEVMNDHRLSPEKRRHEIRQLSKALDALLPKARLRLAELVIRGAEEKIKAAVAPEVVPVPAASAKPVPKPRARAAPSTALEPVPAPKENA